ncbi:formylglycine-generating enzyme family protein [Pontibacter sp. E15-1]|uniref:formylglycine-generating enzyme family protein n=1 Tax=Pontibacter sp. E15-1 TaxID=2919918 RepID=UPI001F4FBB39|nr:formylglycine-generating enzyme family protein [Pontibacter sp. E15-1]MCJ8164330.1 formylglycine-generating enzyme family protein [Pontibacter sp. E15-1]
MQRAHTISYKLGACVALAILSLAGCQQTDEKSSSAANATESAVSSTDAPAAMSLIPGGTFVMGGKSEQADKDELPRHNVTVSGFYMDQTEVTNAQFAEFVDATGYVTIAEKDIDWEEMKTQVPPGTPKPDDSVLKAGSLVFQQTAGPVDLRDYSKWWKWTIGASWKHPEGPGSSIEDRMDHPVVHVAYDDALAYAAWAGKRLPTESEWEWASMGGLEDPKYPWGNKPIEDANGEANFWQGMFPFKNYAKDGYEGTAPVKSYPPNGYGLYDMAGNVWEWCKDKYHVDAYAQAAVNGISEDPTGPRQSYDPTEPYNEKFVIRGGSYLCNESYCSGYRVSRRMRSSKDSGISHTGFRCVKDLE